MTDTTGMPIIGFDLGHGETALALALSGHVDPPAVLDLPGAPGNGRQHVTAVNEHPDRGILVGEAAVWVVGGRLFLAFKSRDFQQVEVKRPIQLFSTKVREDVLGRGKVGGKPTDIRWVFGAPSGWSPTLRESYAALFKAGGFRHVEVVPESRAALLYARDSGETGVRLDSTQVGGRILIVDLGSSTTDFTSVVGRKDRPLDRGSDLGASLIDKVISDRLLTNHAQQDRLEDAIHRDRSQRLRLELLCRKAKEDFFRLDPEVAADPDASVIRTTNLITPTGKIKVDVELTSTDVDEILDTPLRELDGRSWRQAYRDDLLNAAKAMGGKPDVVLLTGGASRMHFVLDVAREEFGANRVMLGTEPESAIARGLALAGRINVHAAGFLQDVASLIDGNQIDALVTERLPALALRMGAAAADGITARHVVPAFIGWRNGAIDTLDEMALKIANDLQAELTNPKNPAIAKAFGDWYNELLPELQDLTRPICTRWHIPPKEMSLPAIDLSGRQWKIGLTDSSAATDMIKNIANVINVVVAGVISTTLFGAGAAIIATTGPFAVIVAAVAAYYILKEGTDAAMEKAKSAKIPLWVRQLRGEAGLVAKVQRNAPTSEKELGEQLANQFLADGGADLVADITKSIGRQFGALADDAKLLVA